MDASVTNFFSKNAADGYAAQYEIDHGPRLDAMLDKWNLRETLKGKRVLDVGGGLGFLGKRLTDVDYWVIDGADPSSFPQHSECVRGFHFLPQDTRDQVKRSTVLCKGTYIKRDLDHDSLTEVGGVEPAGCGNYRSWSVDMGPKFDTAFCLETLEHLTNPYHCLAEMKKLVKEGGDIIISIPHANVTHNYIYPALMIDPNNFAQFLGQLALPVRDYWLWSKGWNAHHFRCENRPYSEKRMLYEKHESKFINATPVEMVNW